MLPGFMLSSTMKLPGFIILFLLAAFTCRSQVFFQDYYREYKEEHQHSVEIVKVCYPVFSGSAKGLVQLNKWITNEVNHFISKTALRAKPVHTTSTDIGPTNWEWMNSPVISIITMTANT